jgi:hypothetical protein
VLQTPYVPPTWTGGQFTSPGAFVAPTVGDALRTGNTYDPAKLPHFARGVQDFSGGQAVVGEQGPETVTLPPGSSVTPNATPEQQQALANIPQGTYQNWQANQQRQQQQQQANAYAQAAGGGLAKQGFNEDGSPYQPAQGTAQAAGSGAAGSAAAPAWGSFYAPSQIDEQNDPGYQARLDLDQQARQRSAAAQGSVLSGGTQLALGRAAQDYASNEYQNVYNRALSARQQNVGEYQNQFNNALGAQGQNFNQALAGYQANYGNYLGQANLDLLGRQQNQNEYLNNQVNPSLTSYQNQYAQYLQGQQQGLNDYLTNYGINRTGVQDFFNQNNAVANRGLSAALGTRYTG